QGVGSLVSKKLEADGLQCVRRVFDRGFGDYPECDAIDLDSQDVTVVVKLTDLQIETEFQRNSGRNRECLFECACLGPLSPAKPGPIFPTPRHCLSIAAIATHRGAAKR